MDKRKNGSRSATHAGTWYESDGDKLNCQISEWFDGVKGSVSNIRAIIAPHAGYRYSGQVAAHSYKHIVPSRYSRIFILGPSHHHSTGLCMIPAVDGCETPIGNLTICTETVQELQETGIFEVMTKSIDEREHSIEMHLPFIAYTFNPRNCRIVPIVVGSVPKERQQEYGSIFAKYLADPSTLFIISSDFMHFGDRFGYTYYNPLHGSVYESICAIDQLAMRAIQTLQPVKFERYLQKYGNTICGRVPISLLLHAVASLGPSQYCMQFLNYAHSAKCTSVKECSVSYVAGALRLM
uniref:AmmeMemoRadiSam system protein B n=1 Tax=Spongospora subterranea TaxID=70186 RepID=A0A0H5RKR8_9EUKA|eukprot:CRZ09309.1 hypothetical protein [Spongospora subterranea]